MSIIDDNRGWYSQHFGIDFSDYDLFDKRYGGDGLHQENEVVPRLRISRILLNQILLGLKAKGKMVLVISYDDRYYHVIDRVVKFENRRLLVELQKKALTFV
ncbi:MAG TPA: hypothetical protein VGV14_04180 [Rhodanobacter sp.]|nr:hypothetical protein [Rhodanobacter sp.]